MECPRCLIVPAPATATGTLEASVMARTQLPAQPHRDLGRLGAHCCFNEKSGARGRLWLGETWRGRALCAALRPSVHTGCRPPCSHHRPVPHKTPRGGARGPLKTQKDPHLQGSWVQPVLRSQLGGYSGASVGGVGEAMTKPRGFVIITPGQRDTHSPWLGQDSCSTAHSPPSVSSTQTARPSCSSQRE